MDEENTQVVPGSVGDTPSTGDDLGTQSDTDQAVETGSEDGTPTGEQPQEQKFNWSGRELTAQELFEEAQKLQGAFTGRSQELAEMKKMMEKISASQDTKPNEPQLSPEDQAALKEAAGSLTPFIKEQLGLDSIIEQQVQERVNGMLAQKEQLAKYQQQFNEVEERAKKAGIPFDKAELVKHMEATQNMSISGAFVDKYYTQLVDYDIQQRNAKKKVVPTATGNSAPVSKEQDNSIKVNSPEAQKSMMERLRQITGG